MTHPQQLPLPFHTPDILSQLDVSVNTLPKDWSHFLALSRRVMKRARKFQMPSLKVLTQQWLPVIQTVRDTQDMTCLHLPFDEVVLEYQLEDASGMPTDVVVVLWKDQGRFVGTAYAQLDVGHWSLLPVCLFEDARCAALMEVVINDQDNPLTEVQKKVLHTWVTTPALILSMATRYHADAILYQGPTTTSVRQSPTPSGKSRTSTYQRVELDLLTPRNVRRSQPTTTSTGITRSPHERRGFYRTCRGGKTVWVSPTVVNAHKGATIAKDYHLPG